MAAIVGNIGIGTAKPTGAVQFGDKFFMTFEDSRPFYLMAGQLDSSLSMYYCGIKAPVTALTAANSGTAAANLTAGDSITFAYAYYSSKRVAYSRLSPTVTHTVANPAKKITLSGFEACRDDMTAQDIDKLIICAQAGLNNGLMTIWPDMVLDISDLNFAKTFTFDLAAATLDLGMDFSAADPYFEIPPAVKFIERYGERLWMGGQRREVILTNTSVTVTKAQTWRGRTLAKVTVSGDTPLDDSHLHMSLYVNGLYQGEIWDVKDPLTAYLDRDTDANVAETILFYLVGHNDRLYPTSYHNETAGAVPIPFPECVNLGDRELLSANLDEGAQLRGLKSAKGALAILFNDCVVMMTGATEVGSPDPYLTTDYGRTGAISPRSICKDAEGSIVYWGEEGPIRASTAGIATIAFDLGINRLTKGGQWMAAADQPKIVMAYSREYDGYIIGGFTIDGAANWWGLIALRPQYGLYLFDGQEITSNILEYSDANGRGVILAGDSHEGRVKRLLDPSTYQDLPAASDTVAAYTWKWRAGWVSQGDGQPFAVAVLRMLGVILPGATVAITGELWSGNYPVRDEDDVAAGDKRTVAITEADLNQGVDIPLPAVTARYHSLGLSAASTSGLDTLRPVEIPRFQLIFDGEL